jgi:hypothetical protein
MAYKVRQISPRTSVEGAGPEEKQSMWAPLEDFYKIQSR